MSGPPSYIEGAGPFGPGADRGRAAPLRDPPGAVAQRRRNPRAGERLRCLSYRPAHRRGRAAARQLADRPRSPGRRPGGERRRGRHALPAGRAGGPRVAPRDVRARGLDVFVCTREPSHRELARRLGAAWVGDVGDAMPLPTDGTILFAPVGELVPLALRNLARGGTLALAGIYMTPVPALEYERDLFYERSIRSVTANTRADGEELLAEAARIPIRPETTTFPLEEANRALQLLKRGASYMLLNEPAIELAEELVRAVPCAEQVRYTSSGTEATFFALRVARAFRKRDTVMKFEGGFHGTHDYGMMSVSPRSPKAFPAPMADSAGIPHAIEGEVLIAPYNDLATAEALIAAHHAQLAAVIIATRECGRPAWPVHANGYGSPGRRASMAELHRPGLNAKPCGTGRRLRDGLAAAVLKHGVAAQESG